MARRPDLGNLDAEERARGPIRRAWRNGSGDACAQTMVHALEYAHRIFLFLPFRPPFFTTLQKSLTWAIGIQMTDKPSCCFTQLSNYILYYITSATYLSRVHSQSSRCSLTFSFLSFSPLLGPSLWDDELSREFLKHPNLRPTHRLHPFHSVLNPGHMSP